MKEGNNRIAAAIRQMRITAGLTQEAMAKELRVPLRTYHGWEHGETQPRASTWERIKAMAAAVEASR